MKCPCNSKRPSYRVFVPGKEQPLIVCSACVDRAVSRHAKKE